MSGPQPPPRADDLPWLAGIRAFEDEIHPERDPIGTWKRRIHDWGFELWDDGQIVERHRNPGDVIGQYLVVPAADGDPAQAALDDGDVGCPFVGPRLAYAAFEVSPLSDAPDRHELFCALVKEGRDAIVHRPSRRRWSAVRRAQQPLDRCTGKWSFDDGAELLTREEGPYARAMCRAFTAACETAGYDAFVGWMSTCHNPMRFSLYWDAATQKHHPALLLLTWKEGNPYLSDREVDNLLSGLTMDVWLYDFTVLNEVVNDRDLWW